MKRHVLTTVVVGVTLLAVGALASATAEPRSKPFQAWERPSIRTGMSIEEARSLVQARTGPQTTWTGPTEGPRAPDGVRRLIYVSADQSYVSYVNWGRGVADAASILGWKVEVLNGRGSVTSTMQAMQQAIASRPDAIITSADAGALQGAIVQAVAAGIPVIGIHASAFPGPDPEMNLYANIASHPTEIGELQAAYVIAGSNGTAKLLHFLDNSFAIARLKAEAATAPIKSCSGCTFVEMVNIPIADQTKRIPTVVSGILANHGQEWWGTTCCDNFYPYVAAALRAAGVAPDRVRLVGSDGPPSAYDMIRSGEYEVATVPEPSTLFGYQAVDAVIRAMAGEAPSTFVQPVYLVTKANVDAEGGNRNEFIPSNNFRCYYRNIWLGETANCAAG